MCLLSMPEVLIIRLKVMCFAKLLCNVSVISTCQKRFNFDLNFKDVNYLFIFVRPNLLTAPLYIFQSCIHLCTLNH